MRQQRNKWFIRFSWLLNWDFHAWQSTVNLLIIINPTIKKVQTVQSDMFITGFLRISSYAYVHFWVAKKSSSSLTTRWAKPCFQVQIFFLTWWVMKLCAVYVKRILLKKITRVAGVPKYTLNCKLNQDFTSNTAISIRTKIRMMALM